MESEHLSLFGAPRFMRDGVNVHIPRRKTLALLAYLAATAHSHRRDALATLLWPEDDPSTGRANLRRALFELRQLLGEQALSIDRAQAGLASETSLSLDVAAFKQRVAQVRDHRHKTAAECESCINTLNEAVDLYNGEFMAGFSLADCPAFDEWQFFEAESLRQAFAKSLQTLVDWHTRHKTYQAAIEYARRWLTLDPLHEPAQRQLMRLYASSNQYSAALRQYQECARQLQEELGVEPAEETKSLYEAIRSQHPVSPLEEGESTIASIHNVPPPSPEPASVVLHNLPLLSAPLIGRELELSRITTLMGRENACRLLTVTGPGGSGKTRLALEAAANLAQVPEQGYRDGIWFIYLASVSDSSGILEKIAQMTGFSFPEGGEQRRQKLLDFLRQKKLLLILDNFEHLMGPTSIELLTNILAVAQGVKILVTSREQLGARDEQIIQLAGLRTPLEGTGLGKEADTLGNESVQLFAQCAARIQLDFRVTPDNLASVARICRLVAGMPLALELAAAWLEVLTPAEIAAEIVRSLDFLEAGWRDLPDRQRSLRAVFESSWSLLSKAERQVLFGLVLFQGGFSRQAAEAVAGASLKELLKLVQKSWLSHDAAGRYFIHELLRQYASAKLQADPEGYQRLMEKYCQYYAAFLEEQFSAMKGPDQREAADAIAAEFENIRAAWGWLVAHQGVQLAVEGLLPALFLFCEARSWGTEIQKMASLAVQILMAEEAADRAPGLLAILLTAKGMFHPLGLAFLLLNPGIVNSPSDREIGMRALLAKTKSMDLPDGPLKYELVLRPWRDLIRQAWSLVGTQEALLELDFWGILLAYLYGLNLDTGQGAQSLRWLAAQFEQKGRHWEEALALYSLGSLLLKTFTPDVDQENIINETKEALSGAVQIFQELGDLRDSGYCLRLLSNLDWPDERRIIQKHLAARELLLQAGDYGMVAIIDSVIGSHYINLCEFESGFRYYQTSIQETLELGLLLEGAGILSEASRAISRFGDLNWARQLREQGLEIARQTENIHEQAWQSWEMGELYRLEGDVHSARSWFDEARQLFDRVDARDGGIFYARGLGDLAQMKGLFDEARHHFQESLRLAKELNHSWAQYYALAGLGRAESRLGESETALSHFKQAYQIARKKYKYQRHLMPLALAGLAGLYLTTGENEKAQKLARFVLGNAAAWQETKAQAGKVLHDLGYDLSDGPVITPVVYYSSDDIDKVVLEIDPDFVR